MCADGVENKHVIPSSKTRKRNNASYDASRVTRPPEDADVAAVEDPVITA